MNSQVLDQYRGYTVSSINGLTNTVEFTNGITISAGEVIGAVNEEHIRRIQIRETIKSHLSAKGSCSLRGSRFLVILHR